MRSNLCDYIDPYMHLKGTVTVSNTAGAEAAVNISSKK